MTFDSSSDHCSRRIGWLGAVGWLFCLVAVIVVYNRVIQNAVEPLQPRPWPVFGFVDFRDTIYGPTRDLATGHNPYDATSYLERYPGRQAFNLYLPHHFLFFGWMAWLSTPVAIVTMGLASTACTGWLIHQGLRLTRAPTAWLPWILTGLVLRGPLLMSIRQGQIAMVLAAASWLAITSRSGRLQAAGVCLALIKPQVGLPVLLVMFVMGRWRSALYGLLAAGVCSIPAIVLAANAAGGPAALLISMLDNLAASARDNTFLIGPLDVVGVSKALGITEGGFSSTVVLLFTASICGLGLVLVSRRAGGAISLEWTWLAALSLVVIFPSLRYSAGPLVPVIVYTFAQIFSRGAPRVPRTLVVAAVMATAAIVRSETVEKSLGAPEIATTQASGWCVMGALLLVLWRIAAMVKAVGGQATVITPLRANTASLQPPRPNRGDVT